MEQNSDRSQKKKSVRPLLEYFNYALAKVEEEISIAEKDINKDIPKDVKAKKIMGMTRVQFESALNYLLEAGIDLQNPNFLIKISGFFTAIAAVFCLTIFYVANSVKEGDKAKSLLGAIWESWDAIKDLRDGNYEEVIESLEGDDLKLLGNVITSKAWERMYYDNKDNIKSLLNIRQKALDEAAKNPQAPQPEALAQLEGKSFMQMLAGKNLTPLFNVLGEKLDGTNLSTKVALVQSIDEVLKEVSKGKEGLLNKDLEKLLGGLTNYDSLHGFLQKVLFSHIAEKNEEYIRLTESRAKLLEQAQELDKKNSELTKTFASLIDSYSEALKAGDIKEIERLKKWIGQELERPEVQASVKNTQRARAEFSKDLAAILVDFVKRLGANKDDLKAFLNSNHSELINYIAIFLPEGNLKEKLSEDHELMGKLVDVLLIALENQDEKSLKKFAGYISTFMVAKSKYELELDKAEAIVAVAEPGRFVPEAYEPLVNNILSNTTDVSVQWLLNFSIDALPEGLKMSEASLAGPLQNSVKGLNLEDDKLQRFMKDGIVQHLAAVGGVYKQMLNDAKVLGETNIELDKKNQGKTDALVTLIESYNEAVKLGDVIEIERLKKWIGQELETAELKSAAKNAKAAHEIRSKLSKNLAVIFVDLVSILNVNKENLKDFLTANHTVIVEYLSLFIPEAGKAGLQIKLKNNPELLANMVDLLVIAFEKQDEKSLEKFAEYLSTFMVAKSKYELELDKAEAIVAVAEPGRFVPEAYEPLVNNILSNTTDVSVQWVLNFSMDALPEGLKMSEASLAGPLKNLVKGLNLEDGKLQRFMKDGVVQHLAAVGGVYKGLLDQAKILANKTSELKAHLKDSANSLTPLYNKYLELEKEASEAKTPKARQEKFNKRDEILREIKNLINNSEFENLRKESEATRHKFANDLAIVLIDLGNKLKKSEVNLVAFLEDNKVLITEYIINFLPKENREVFKQKISQEGFYKDFISVISSIMDGHEPQDLEKFSYFLSSFIVGKGQEELTFERAGWFVKNVLEKGELGRLKLKANEFKNIYEKWYTEQDASKKQIFEKEMNAVWNEVLAIAKYYPQMRGNLSNIENKPNPRMFVIKGILLQLNDLFLPTRFDLVPEEYKPLAVKLVSADSQSVATVMNVVPDVLNMLTVNNGKQPDEFGYEFSIDDAFKSMLKNLLYKNEAGKTVFNQDVFNGMLKPLLQKQQKEFSNFGDKDVLLLDKLGQGIGNMANVGLIPGIKQLVEFIVSDKELLKFVKGHPKELGGVIKYSLNFFNQDLKWNGMDKKIFESLDVLLKKPEALMPILDLMVPDPQKPSLSGVQIANAWLQAIKGIIQDQDIGEDVKKLLNKKEIKQPLKDMVVQMMNSAFLGRETHRMILSYNAATQPMVESLFANISLDSINSVISVIDKLLNSSVASNLYNLMSMKNMQAAAGALYQYKYGEIYKYTDAECDILRKMLVDVFATAKPGQDLIFEMIAQYDKLSEADKRVLLREKIASGYLAQADLSNLNSSLVFGTKPFSIPAGMQLNDLSFNNTKFENPTFGVGATLNKVDLSGIAVKGKMTLAETRLSEVVFDGSNIPELDLDGTEIGVGCTFLKANILKLTFDRAKLDMFSAVSIAESMNLQNSYRMAYWHTMHGQGVELTSQSDDIQATCKQLELIAKAANAGSSKVSFSVIKLPNIRNIEVDKKQYSELKKIIAKLDVEKLVIGDKEISKDSLIKDIVDTALEANKDDPSYKIFVKGDLGLILQKYATSQLLQLEHENFVRKLSETYSRLPQDAYLFTNLQSHMETYLNLTIAQSKSQGWSRQ